MNTIQLNTALIAIEILSVDKSSNTANINFAYAEANASGKAKKWHRVDINELFITGRAKKNLLDPGNIDYQISTKEDRHIYSSVNNSPNQFDNPFCLMRKHAIDKDGNSYATYYLKCVEENGSYNTQKTMPNGDIVVNRIWNKNKPAYMFKRYVDCYHSQKAYHDKSQQEVVESA